LFFEEEEEDHDACFITNQRIIERVCEFERGRDDGSLERRRRENFPKT
jgi:hypothetical protein